MTIYEIRTENSTYQVDNVKVLVRRVGGDNPPTPRFPDDQWKKALAILHTQHNQMLILWPIDTEGELKNSTTTTPILDAHPVDEP